MRAENIAARTIGLLEARQIVLGDFSERARRFEIVGDRERLPGENHALDVLASKLDEVFRSDAMRLIDRPGIAALA